MVLNIWNQIFGLPYRTGNGAAITTTAINENCDAAINVHTLAASPLMAGNRDQRDKRDQSVAAHDVSYFSLYILFASLFVCIFTIGILLLSHVNRVSDINQLRDNIKNDFIAKSDISRYVWVALRELRESGGGIHLATTRMMTSKNSEDSKPHENDDRDDDQPLQYDRGADGDDVTTSVAADAENYDDTAADGHRYSQATQRKHSPPRLLVAESSHILRERRAANIYTDNIVSDAQNAVETSFVDFFNPKIRRELEMKDEEIKKSTGLKGAAPGGDEWVWLTSYSRIPYDAITGFCSATKEYCPPGPAGIPGQPGVKGPRGDIGIPGPAGREGPIGPRGPKGMPGNPGLDGRDGVPGEPGLDGVPGRAGADGISGKDGKDGIPGLDGRNGINGKDGKEGQQGPQGPPGMPGERGLSGPRGRTGRPGLNGSPGIPGINAWKVRINGSDELLIPPTIAGAGTPESMRPIVVHEGEHLRLRCAATGNPKPHIEWRRLDGKTIAVGAWQASSMPGHTLNITSINRVHMGAYQCLADNGVPVAANATFYIEVHFAPLVRVRRSDMYAVEGGSVTLECESEAFPEPLKYWKRMSDNRVIDETEKYRIQTYQDGYKSVMQLNITRLRVEDFGEYQCVLKNDVNTTVAPIYVYDRFKHPQPPRNDFNKPVVTYGTLPPRKESYEDICGPPATCPDCPDFKCKDSLVTLYDLVGNLEIKPTENNYPGLPLRVTDCILYAVGKPVYNKFTDMSYGSWLKDPNPRNDDYGEKIWATMENDPYHVYEYASKTAYRNNSPRTINLRNPFRGNTHVVYNGSFYYQKKDSGRIIRFDLESSKELSERDLPKLASNGTNYLYTTEYNYVDFNVDDNGLWVIYTSADSNNTIVAKLDANNLTTQYSWNISINHHKVGEMFIVCGVLYAVDSVTERNTKIRLALDLYRNNVVDDVNLAFTNPFKKTTTVGYNHRTKELYTWDKGNQLSYPTRYHDLGIGSFNLTGHDKNDDNLNPQMQTGFDIYPDASASGGTND